MTDSKRLENFLDRAKKLDLFKWGEHVSITDKLNVYTASDYRDNESSETYFSFKFDNTEITHFREKGLEVTNHETSFLPTDYEAWFTGVHAELMKAERAQLVPQEVTVNGRTYKLVSEEILVDDIPF